MQIRNLERHEAGNGRRYWTAELVEGETRVLVDTRNGAWIARLAEGPRFVKTAVAQRLQAKVRPLVKREQAEAERAEAEDPEAALAA